MSCWIDELPPPNGSDPVHEGGTVSKDEVILFPPGLLGCPSWAVRDLGSGKLWVTQVCLGGRREAGVVSYTFTL